MSAAEALPAQPDEYIHSQLQHQDSIRLMNLEPAASQDAELVCTIYECRLQDTPRFEALSYVWGEPMFCETLRTTKGVLQITTSLATALKYFRLTNDMRSLWADAICIDQSNNDEKGHQVAQMGQVYRNAERVLAWLGHGTKTTRQAMLDYERLYPFAERYHVEENDIDFDAVLGPSLKEMDKSGKAIILTTWDLSAARDDNESVREITNIIRTSKLEDLVALPWFSRLWVIQEVANSSSTTLHCGNHSLDWKVFASVLRLLVAIFELQGPPQLIGLSTRDQVMTVNLKRAWSIVHLRNVHRATSKMGFFTMSVYRQFGECLSRAYLHRCTDDRDRIYALLSLISELAQQHGIKVQPDYKKAAPEIYRDFALLYLMTTESTHPRDARILSDAGLWQRTAESWNESVQLGSASPEYLSSWVPEYRPRNLSHEKLLWNDARFSTRWHTCPPGIHEFPGNRNILGVSASLVGRIEWLMESRDDGVPIDQMTPTAGLSSLSTQSNWTTIAEFLEAARELSKRRLQHDRYFTGEDGRAALSRTLVADCSHFHITRLMFNYPDTKDEARMVALWEAIDQCLLQPQGELRLSSSNCPGHHFRKRKRRRDNRDHQRKHALVNRRRTRQTS